MKPISLRDFSSLYTPDMTKNINLAAFYSLLTISLTSIFLGLVFITERIFRQILGYGTLQSIIFASFIIIFIFQPLWDKLQAVVDKLFSKKKYDYQQALIESSRPLTLLTDLPTLLKLTSRIITRKMQLLGSSILIHDEFKDQYLIKAAEGSGKSLIGQVFSTETPLIQYLKTKKSVLSKAEIFNELADNQTDAKAIQVSFASLQAVICFPAVWRGKLVGALFLDRKISGEKFNPQDIELLKILAQQGALAVKNAMLFDNLKNRSEELRSLFLASKKVTLDLNIENKIADIANILKGSIDFIDAFEIEIYKNQIKLNSNEPLEGTTATIPLTVDNEKFGHLVISTKQRKRLRQEEINLVAVFAEQVAATIKVATLYQDLKDAQQKLIEAERMATLGTLAAGVAHEIKNPLTPIKTFIQILGSQIHHTDFLLKFDAIVQPEINRLNTLLGNLIGFSKSTPLKLETKNLNEIIGRQLQRMTEYFKGFNVEILLEFSDLPPILVDEDKFIQALMNFVLNAVQAIKEAGRQAGQLKVITQQNGDFVTIAIRDNGNGIAADNLKSLFKEFFTTKEKGTGLGLYITHKIIREHRGRIEVESQVGVGTTFKIYLPLKG